MNAKEINFAYKVRHALNENLDTLPSSTVDRLASARKIALNRKKSRSGLRVLVPRAAFAGQIGNFFSQPLIWTGRMIGVALPVVVVVAGLIGIFQSEQQQRIQETADIDAAVLSDELPLTAYLDHGFNAYLAKRVE
jgi:hypothetical protein